MSKVRYVEAMYNTAVTWDIEDIAERYDFKIEDIKNLEVGKWVKIFITLVLEEDFMTQISFEIESLEIILQF